MRLAISTRNSVPSRRLYYPNSTALTTHRTATIIITILTFANSPPTLSHPHLPSIPPQLSQLMLSGYHQQGCHHPHQLTYSHSNNQINSAEYIRKTPSCFCAFCTLGLAIFLRNCMCSWLLQDTDYPLPQL